MPVVFGADHLAISILEHPQVHLAVTRAVEFAADERAGLVDQARARFPRCIEVFPDLRGLSLAVVEDAHRWIHVIAPERPTSCAGNTYGSRFHRVVQSPAS